MRSRNGCCELRSSSARGAASIASTWSSGSIIRSKSSSSEMSSYFTRLAARIGRPVGVPSEYDASVYRHQLPGGMTSTLRRQLGELDMGDRWDDVLDEIPRVREALGWPIMVTPLSQFIGVQAFLNVTTGLPWSQIPDEVVKYVLGHYGAPPGELDPDVEAKVLASPQAEQFQGEEHRLDLADARARYGDRMSDEELLLRMTLPADQVDAMRRGWRPLRLQSPVVELTQGLAARPLREIEVEAPGLRLRLRR